MAVVVVDSPVGITLATASLVAVAGTSVIASQVIASQVIASLAASLVAVHTFAAGTWATAHTFMAGHSRPDTTVGSKLGSTEELA